MSEPGYEGKSYVIPKRLLWDAWLKVKEKGGSAGADGMTIEQFEQGLEDRLTSANSLTLFRGASR